MGGGGVSASPLLTGLVSHWTMDETTGNRVDSHGSYDMVPTGTVGYDTGVLGNCATMATGAVNYLQCVNDAILALSLNAITLAGWIYIPTAFAANCTIFSKGAELQLYIETDGIDFNVGDTAGGQSSIDYNVTLNADTWYFVAARIDVAGDRKAKVKVNDGDWAVAVNAIIAGEDVKNTTNYFRVNRAASGTYGTCWYDSLSFWTRALQDSEIDLLYNEGAGLDYPFS
jgi:hypothetical protein